MPNTLALRREEVYQRLRKDILSCVLPPGQSLHEVDLAAQFRVSKSPIRDALMRLEAERLITVMPRKGYRVAPLSLSDAEEVFAFRAMLEETAIRMSAAAASDEDLAALDRFRSLKTWGGTGSFLAYNREFHVALAAICPNRRICTATQDLVDQFDRLVLASISVVDNRNIESLVAEHAAIIDALQARKGRRAARLIGDHVSRARKRVVTVLSQSAVVP